MGKMGHFPHAIGNGSFSVRYMVVVTTVYLNAYILFFVKSQAIQCLPESFKHSLGFFLPVLIRNSYLANSLLYGIASAIKHPMLSLIIIYVHKVRIS